MTDDDEWGIRQGRLVPRNTISEALTDVDERVVIGLPGEDDAQLLSDVLDDSAELPDALSRWSAIGYRGALAAADITSEAADD